MVAREEYKVRMRALGVFVCPGTGRMCRPLRVRFVPEGTTFREE
jgi:hypothetical protein